MNGCFTELWQVKVIAPKRLYYRLERSRPIAACASCGHKTVTPEVPSAHVSDYYVCIGFEE